MALFRSIASDRGPTILMITHNPECAAQADAVLEMRDGAVVASRVNPRRAGAEVQAG
jgi:ABC-type lipoprotein export system ATPase subunit